MTDDKAARQQRRRMVVIWLMIALGSALLIEIVFVVLYLTKVIYA